MVWPCGCKVLDVPAGELGWEDLVFQCDLMSWHFRFDAVGFPNFDGNSVISIHVTLGDRAAGVKDAEL